MQKILGRPSVPIFFFVFGFVLSQLGYVYLRHGFFRYTSQDGSSRLISQASEPFFYWAVSGGMAVLGALCFAAGAYALVCLIRVCRTEGVAQFRPNNIALIGLSVAVIMILFAVFVPNCSHR